jgi:hypothetical protein
MKTTRAQIENSRRYEAESRTARTRFAVLNTDCDYSVANVASFRGQRVGGRASHRSFWKISDDYLQYEAPQSFVAEAGAFALMVVTAALPLFDGASALAHFVRAIGAF